MQVFFSLFFLTARVRSKVHSLCNFFISVIKDKSFARVQGFGKNSSASHRFTTDYGEDEKEEEEKKKF
jgi:hypothetical protein